MRHCLSEDLRGLAKLAQTAELETRAKSRQEILCGRMQTSDSHAKGAMSLETPDPQFQVFINSPRSIIALCRHGYGPEDLYLKPKEDFVEETKDPARGKLYYDGTLKKLQRRLSEVKATFDEIKRNGISEEEWDFLG